MLEYALKYAALGWAIFPCRPNDKRPATQHECLDATTDPKQIRAWWNKQPDLNIGLACGEISGITALDIDPRSNGHEFLAAAIDDNEPIDGVWESQTGGGGTHFLLPLQLHWVWAKTTESCGHSHYYPYTIFINARIYPIA